MRTYFVYILAKHRNGALYIGFTNDIRRRVQEHINGAVDSHTRKQKIKKLVYLEETSDIQSAKARERQLKAWRRDWKIALIESENPGWNDLFPDL